MVMLVGFCSIIFRPTFFSITSILPSSFCYSPNIGLHSTIAMPYIQNYGTKEQKVSKHSFDFWMYELYSLVHTSSSSCLLWTRPKWKCTQVTKGPSFKRKSKSKTRHRTAISRRWLLGSALQAWQSLSRMQAATCRSLLCSLLQSYAGQSCPIYAVGWIVTNNVGSAYHGQKRCLFECLVFIVV